MKRSRLFLLLGPCVSAFIAIVASCTAGTDSKSLKAGTGRYYQPAKDAGDGSTLDGMSLSLDADLPDVFFEMPRELKGPGQALQVLITSYDLESKEAEIGKFNGSTPAMKAYCADLMEDLKASRARAKALASKKKVALARSSMTQRMVFESEAAINHLQNIFKNMWNDAYISRRIDTANNMLRVVDDELAPILTDDDYKAELATVREELDKRITRAEAVRNGLSEGTAEGMFEVPGDPAGPLARDEEPAEGPPEPEESGDAGP